jgi:hypothetical protein
MVSDDYEADRKESGANKNTKHLDSSMRPKRGKKWIQGTFRPVHPEKYAGDPTTIQYRSSWELRVFMRLDLDPNVEKWGSEELIVGYYDPVKKRDRRYFPDLVVKFRNGDVEMWEIKRAREQEPPKRTKAKRQKTFLKEVATYETNMAKWKAAARFCEKRGWRFRVLNERDLGIKR